MNRRASAPNGLAVNNFSLFSSRKSSKKPADRPTAKDPRARLYEGSTNSTAIDREEEDDVCPLESDCVPLFMLRNVVLVADEDIVLEDSTWIDDDGGGKAIVPGSA